MDKTIKTVLVFWGRWMLGNAVVRFLKLEGYHVISTVSSHPDDWEIVFRVNKENLLDDLGDILSQKKYDYVINCIWNIRPTDTKENIYESFLINSYFPQLLWMVSTQYQSRLIHVSTDCVFAWKKGSSYSCEDIPDETGVYGMSKFLWEVHQRGNITIRTSIIGRELGDNKKNLLDWFLSQSDDTTVYWYTNVFWNGVTTLTLAKIIGKIIDEDLLPQGWFFQVGSEIVSKFQLLNMAKDVFHKKITILPDDTIISDKTIISSDGIISSFGDIVTPLKDQVQDLYEFYK